MIVGLLGDGEETAYEAFIRRVNGSRIYHTLEWKRVIERTYSYRAHYVVAKEGSSIGGALPLFEVRSAILGNRLVSIPFSHWVNILYEGDVAMLEDLLAFACDVGRKRKCRYLEIKHGYPLPSAYGLERSEHFLNSVLDLSRGIDEVWSGFKGGSVRWGISRARRSDLEVRKGLTLEDYRTFYRLELRTRKSQGVPPYPFRFFRNLRDHLGNGRNLRLYLAYLGDVCIAGIIILCHKRHAVYGYSASLKRSDMLRTQPNNLLLWTAIQELHNEGYHELDFGITDPSNEGLLRFKTGWGTRDCTIPYYYFLYKPGGIPTVDRTSRRMRIAMGMLRKLPIPVFERVGPFLLEQVG